MSVSMITRRGDYNSEDVQGVKLFGNELTKDPQKKVNVDFGMKVFGRTISPQSNQFNLNWENFALYEGSFSPYLTGHPVDADPEPKYSPTCSYAYRSGYFIKFASFCYINIKLKCTISSVYSGETTYVTVGGLDFFDTYGFVPREGIGAFEYCLTTSEITIIPGSGTMEGLNSGVSSDIAPGDNQIWLEKNNGTNEIVLGTVTEGFWYSVSGIFPTSDV